jgi:hypothetical protein
MLRKWWSDPFHRYAEYPGNRSGKVGYGIGAVVGQDELLRQVRSATATQEVLDVVS